MMHCPSVTWSSCAGVGPAQTGMGNRRRNPVPGGSRVQLVLFPSHRGLHPLLGRDVIGRWSVLLPSFGVMLALLIRVGRGPWGCCATGHPSHGRSIEDGEEIPRASKEECCETPGMRSRELGSVR